MIRKIGGKPKIVWRGEIPTDATPSSLACVSSENVWRRFEIFKDVSLIRIGNS